MNEERIWYLLSLSLSGESTAEEAAELQELLRRHPEAGLRAEILQNIWKSQPEETTTAGSFDKHLQRLSTHLSEPVLQFETPDTNARSTNNEQRTTISAPRSRYRWVWAAGIAASLLIAFLIFYPGKGPKMVSNTVSTKAGSKSKIQLPDGTQVWLNADSKIKYNQDFMGAYREVQLTGEAYFDVAKDKSRPFIIHTGPIDVKVVGTSFNVRAYPNEKITETALIQGVVEITLRSNPDKKIILKPSEKLTVQSPPSPEIAEPVKNNAPADGPTLTLGKIRYGKTDSTGSIETMWVRNKLAFENETFERITTEMERWYNVKFVIKKEALKTVYLTGIFENKSLAEVMEALRLSASFQYQVREGTVTVW
jgi:ferric-dicitrate binding protein FerR (iron transport regulator)